MYMDLQYRTLLDENILTAQMEGGLIYALVFSDFLYPVLGHS